MRNGGNHAPVDVSVLSCLHRGWAVPAQHRHVEACGCARRAARPVGVGAHTARDVPCHGGSATFFVKSGTVGNSGNMTWTQVTSLASAGNDVGGKTVSSANLTTDPNPTSQVCNDRQSLIQHGLSPVAFAYPGGAYNSSVQTIVKN